MDFFERQDEARRKTKWLILCFAMAVIGTVVAVYLACVVIIRFVVAPLPVHLVGAGPAEVLWDPKIFLYSSVGTLAVIAVGTVYRLQTLS
ncbi:MAG: hypothetical protein N3G20_00280, partial [Verrucomicrobiae bacterium]|nr:hypothetical protein [Verrucomicrobiae bacterium]